MLFVRVTHNIEIVEAKTIEEVRKGYGFAIRGQSFPVCISCEPILHPHLPTKNVDTDAFGIPISDCTDAAKVE